ncbi:toll/interleukin-1 receptor domain-containing protein [Saccharothrix sp. Mg75]|uniref:toll/interleukin-1 receptor domain-containing protein n=1 Tax=Saccharothrix sp. Mg75 TaxID=3445357 RepID=UPI003EE85FDD
MSYVHEDVERVDKLCAMLEAARIPYWRDRDSLAPGDDWKRKIREAIRSGTLLFLACFSERSQAKARGYMNEELALAAEEFRMLPPEATWLVPVRFAEVDVPKWDLGAGRTLSDIQYVNLFGKDEATAAEALIAMISRVVKTAMSDVATVPDSADRGDVAARVNMMRQAAKDAIPEPAMKIKLNDLVLEEARRILTAMRDSDRFPTGLPEGSGEDRMVRCAELAASYWQLAEPFCASLQVAARWGEGQSLAPWVSALKAIAGEAAKLKSGDGVLLNLHHVPALVSVFTAALAATGQGRWDNLKTLLVDVTIPQQHGTGRQVLIDAENPWVPFEGMDRLLPSVISRSAKTGEDPRTALRVFTGRQSGVYYTPVAEWLHTILQPHFVDQYIDEAAFDDAFDRAEVMLGLISQDFASLEAGDAAGRSWLKHSNWFGRSTWRARYGSGAVGEIKAEIDAQGDLWAPLSVGLFGGKVERAVAAVEGYSEMFNKMARTRF